MSSTTYKSKSSGNPVYKPSKTNQNNLTTSLPVQAKGENESESNVNTSEYQGLPSNAIINNIQRSFNTGNNSTPVAPIQAKLTIGAPGDQYEQEADQVASEVVQKMNAPATPSAPSDNNGDDPIQRKLNISTLQRQGAIERKLQGKFNFQAPNIQADFESNLNGAKSGGSPLDNAFRAKIEPLMGANFSGVKVHHDANASDLSQSIQAKAFTTGNDIFFKQGEYNPSSKGGQELLAHELTHTIQQGSSPQVQASPQTKINSQIQAKSDLIQRDPDPTTETRGRSSAVSVPKINEGIILDRLTKESFKKITYEGTFSGRGSTLKEIEGLLDELHNLRPLNATTVNNAIDIANSIEELIRFWIEDHADDSSRTNRMVGMRQCHNYVKDNLIPVLHKKSQYFTLTGQTITPTSREAPNGVKELQEKHTGSAKSMFTKLGWMLDMSVPSNGDKSKIEIEFKIPVDPSGVGFIGGRFTCEGERDDNLVKARGEMAITGGAKIGIAEIKGELGGYIEAQAKTSDQVMQLISYSMYRRFEESKWLPRALSSFAWGGSTSKSVGFKRAERWAAAVEKDVFGGLQGEDAENTYVETGGLASIGAEFNIGIGKATGQIKGTTGRRYDKESIEGLKQGGLGSARKTASLGEAQEVIAKSVHSLEVSGGIEAGPIKGEGKLMWQWMQGVNPTTKKPTPATLKTWELEVSGALSLPINELVGSGIAPYMGQFVTSIIELVRKGQDQASNKAQDVGTGASLAENTAIGVTQLAKVPSEQFTPKFEFEESSGFSGSTDLKLTLKIESGGKGSLSLDYVKSVGVDLGVFKGAMEKSKRILKLSYEGGQWKFS